APAFPGLIDAAATANCGVQISWGAASSNCPLGAAITYNIYRSNIFPPSLLFPYATTTATSFSETNLKGVRYFYLVRAEDSPATRHARLGDAELRRAGLHGRRRRRRQLDPDADLAFVRLLGQPRLLRLVLALVLLLGQRPRRGRQGRGVGRRRREL